MAPTQPPPQPGSGNPEQQRAGDKGFRISKAVQAPEVLPAPSQQAQDKAYKWELKTTSRAFIRKTAEKIIAKFPGEFPAEVNMDPPWQTLDPAHWASLPTVHHDRALFWTDDSYKPVTGCSGAGVVELRPPYRDDESCLFAHEYPIGQNVGDNNDAELFAIGAALDLVLKNRADGAYDPKFVLIFSDSQSAIIALQQKKPAMLGPIEGHNWALERIYESAAELRKTDVKLIISWVKAHNISKWNNKADRAANKAVNNVTTWDIGVDVVVPPEITSRGEEVVAEFRNRASELWRVSGRGICHVKSRGGAAQDDTMTKAIMDQAQVLVNTKEAAEDKHDHGLEDDGKIAAKKPSRVIRKGLRTGLRKRFCKTPYQPQASIVDNQTEADLLPFIAGLWAARKVGYMARRTEDREEWEEEKV